VTIPPQSDLELDVAQDLARRMAELFPRRVFGIRDAEAERLRAELGQMKDEARTELAALRTANVEATNLVATQREAVQESAIKHHAEVFKDEARNHFKLAVFWLVVAWLAVLGLFGVAGTFEGTDAVSQASSQEAGGATSDEGAAAALASFNERALIIHILERVTLLSILATILGVSVRLLRTSLHNWVVATHRSNALRSYEAFAAATKDKPGSDELLAQALALTFTPTDTGYSKMSGAPDAALLFTEIVKRAPGGKAG
jgi:hypothetical protein